MYLMRYDRTIRLLTVVNSIIIINKFEAYHISSNRDVFIEIYYSSPGEIANWPTNIPK